VVLMHMRGTPQNMQKGNLVYADIMGEIIAYLKKSSEKTVKAGIEKDCLVIDP